MALSHAAAHMLYYPRVQLYLLAAVGDEAEQAPVRAHCCLAPSAGRLGRSRFTTCACFRVPSCDGVDWGPRTSSATLRYSIAAKTQIWSSSGRIAIATVKGER
eukprot:scaffold1146_cov399-Prasinococcus_capsulatus_cf.AAC.20